MKLAAVRAAHLPWSDFHKAWDAINHGTVPARTQRPSRPAPTRAPLAALRPPPLLPPIPSGPTPRVIDVPAPARAQFPPSLPVLPSSATTRSGFSRHIRDAPFRRFLQSPATFFIHQVHSVNGDPHRFRAQPSPTEFRMVRHNVSLPARQAPDLPRREQRRLQMHGSPRVRVIECRSTHDERCGIEHASCVLLLQFDQQFMLLRRLPHHQVHPEERNRQSLPAKPMLRNLPRARPHHAFRQLVLKEHRLAAIVNLDVVPRRSFGQFLKRCLLTLTHCLATKAFSMDSVW